MTPKPKFPRAVAIEVCREIVPVLQPQCVRLIIAGSLRRRKQAVGDIEILYLPTFRSERTGLFEGDTEEVSRVDDSLGDLIKGGIIAKRKSVLDRETWGPKIKLAVHVRTGVPIDFFSTRPEYWANYLVCRTGPAELNTTIATLANQKGWKWHPFTYGFEQLSTGDKFIVKDERDVFEFVGLDYLKPEQRV